MDERERGELEKRVEGARREVAALAKTKGVIQERGSDLETEIKACGAPEESRRHRVFGARGDSAFGRRRGERARDLERDSRATDVDKIERETKRDASRAHEEAREDGAGGGVATAEAAEKTHARATRLFGARSSTAVRVLQRRVEHRERDEQPSAVTISHSVEERLRTEEKQTARDLRVPAMEERRTGAIPKARISRSTRGSRSSGRRPSRSILEERFRMIEDEADAIMCPNEAVAGGLKARQRQVETIEAGLVDQARSPARRVREAKIDRHAGLATNAASAGGDHQRELQSGTSPPSGARRVQAHPERGRSGDRLDLWKLEIWVKFRAATDMHILDAHRQSGERSVNARRCGT